ncbi:MAG: hypothetical protein CMN28_09795 [Salinisphaeraceae bacterium]|nr:hypothetical protein [Salinisphaeraceae bacterium]
MGTTDTGNTLVMFDDGDFFEGGDFNPEFPVCLISSDFREDGGPTVYNLTADHVYLMPNTVNVGNGGQQGLAEGSAEDVTLNIEAGVQIFARKDTDTVLRVTRGSTINVNGTIDEPVMMTAVDANADDITGDPTDMTGRGDWGGLVLAGYATIESPTGEDQSEAAPDTDIDVFFGGNNDADSSGSVNYLIIGESGFTFGANEEVQGLTVEGVGSGTTLSNIQIFGSDDDGVEFFGGTASISNLVINAQTDDALDLDQGYRGTIKNVIVRMGSVIGNSAHEGDGNIGTTFDDAPITRPIIANALLLGAGLTDSLAVRMREGYGADFENVVVADANVVDTISSGAYGVGCFTNENEVDEDLNALNVAFFCANGTTPAGAADVADNLYSVWAMGMFDEDGDGTGDGTVTFMAAEDQNISVDGSTYEVTTPGFTPDFSLTSAADDYMGAVDPNGTPFWQGWTVNLANSN